MTKAKYTPTERKRIADLIHDLPGEFYNNREWESVVSEMYEIIQAKKVRQPHNTDPRRAHTTDDRQAGPV